MDLDLGGDADESGEHNEYSDLAAGGDEVAPEFNQKDSILFVIDARQSMCTPVESGKPSHFSQALGCALACVRDRIHSGESDLVGVLLFGTEKMKVPNGHQNFPHIYVLQELEQPSAASMRQLELIAKAKEAARVGAAASELDDAAAAAAEAFGHADSSSALELANVLWVTSMIFNSAAKNTRRRLYLMTDDDNPCAGSAAARSRALTRSRDLQDARVWMEPFFFAPAPPASFDLSEGSFWRELVGTVRDNYKGPPPKEAAPSAGSAADELGSGLIEDTSSAWVTTCVLRRDDEAVERVRRKAHKKRVTWSSELTIRDGYALSFHMVSVLRPTPKPAQVKLFALDNTLLMSESLQRDASTGAVLDKGDVFKGYNYGGKWVFFEPYELQSFGKEGFAPGLTLLGFKDASRLKLQHNLGPSKFVEPCEKVPGSTAAMGALVRAMVSKGKVGLARMLKGKVGQARLVALLPQEHMPDPLTGATKLPCGLHVLELPFSDDIRAVDKPAALTEDQFEPGQLDATRELVQALTLPPGASPIGRISNPASATHFQYLECLALHVPGAEVVATVDGTLPDGAWLATKRPQLEAFQQVFGLPTSAEADAASGGAAKRPKTSAGSSAAPKPELPGSLQEWLAAYRDERLESFTIPTLKEFCKANGLPVGGKKGDLVARVHDWLEKAKDDDAPQVGDPDEAPRPPDTAADL